MSRFFGLSSHTVAAYLANTVGSDTNTINKLMCVAPSVEEMRNNPNLVKVFNKILDKRDFVEWNMTTSIDSAKGKYRPKAYVAKVDGQFPFRVYKSCGKLDRETGKYFADGDSPAIKAALFKSNTAAHGGMNTLLSIIERKYSYSVFFKREYDKDGHLVRTLKEEYRGSLNSGIDPEKFAPANAAYKTIKKDGLKGGSIVEAGLNEYEPSWPYKKICNPAEYIAALAMLLKGNVDDYESLAFELMEKAIAIQCGCTEEEAKSALSRLCFESVFMVTDPTAVKDYNSRIIIKQYAETWRSNAKNYVEAKSDEAMLLDEDIEDLYNIDDIESEDFDEIDEEAKTEIAEVAEEVEDDDEYEVIEEDEYEVLDEDEYEVIDD